MENTETNRLFYITELFNSDILVICSFGGFTWQLFWYVHFKKKPVSHLWGNMTFLNITKQKQQAES